MFSFGLSVVSGARTPELEATDAGARVQPGSTLTATWALPAGRLAGSDEMELVLSLDGGRTFPVRLTGRIPVDARSATWRAPALPSGTVRLALRAGRQEEEESEELLAVSEPFAIEAPSGPVDDALFPVGREWRTREALEGLPALPPGGDLTGDAGDSRIAPSGTDDPGAETPPALAPVIPAPASRELVPDPPSGGWMPPVRVERPAALPLRL